MPRPYPFHDYETRPLAPFPRPVPIPASAFDTGDQYQLTMNGPWLARVLGALETLLQHDAWQGDETDQAAAVEEATRLMIALPASGGGGMSIGTIFPYATTTPPAGSVACDGTVYADTDYPDFWAVINPAWKTDATHWAIDARDLFLVGAGGAYAPGATGGENSHTLVLAEMPAHGGHATIFVNAQSGGTALYPPNQPGGYTLGNDQPHENRPPYLGMPYAIQVE